MAKGTKVKTKVGELKYVNITGEGKNNAMKGEEPRMQYTASLVCPKDGEIHKHFQAQIDAEWETYKKANGVKGLPKTNGIKDEMKDDPSGEIDPATEAIKKIPTGNVLITFKTNTKWADGNPQVIKVFAGPKGDQDITAAVQRAPWTIGNGSVGIIHGVAQGNNIGGTQKVTLYLSAVQLAKLVKYEGDSVEVEEIEDAEEIDLGDDIAGIDTTQAGPNL